MSVVLVVDDEHDIRSYATITLRLEGHEVIEASNGREALAAIARADPDLVLLDLRMPVMDGWEVLDHMQRDGSIERIPVVIISAHASPATAMRALDLGSSAYINKPFTPEELNAAVARWARKARAEGPTDS